MTKPETIGDVMEAWLGLCFLCCHPDGQTIRKVEQRSRLLLDRLRQNVEQVILWIYDHWKTPKLHEMMVEVER